MTPLMVCKDICLAMSSLDTGLGTSEWLEIGELVILLANVGHNPGWSPEEHLPLLSPRLGKVWVRRTCVLRDMQEVEVP